MAAPRQQIRTHRYVSGWCNVARHDRCKGSYAGTACCCRCHAHEAHRAGAAGAGTGGAETGETAAPSPGSAK